MRRPAVHDLPRHMYVLVLVPLAGWVMLNSPSFPSAAIASPEVAFASTSAAPSGAPADSDAAGNHGGAQSRP
jgi:hypothetical protein